MPLRLLKYRFLRRGGSFWQSDALPPGGSEFRPYINFNLQLERTDVEVLQSQ